MQLANHDTARDLPRPQNSNVSYKKDAVEQDHWENDFTYDSKTNSYHPRKNQILNENDNNGKPIVVHSPICG